MKYDYLVFIGRFQPFHLGHLKVVQQAKKLAKNVIILVGGQGKARSDRNPFTFEQRKAMIANSVQDVIILPIRDFTYDDTKWVLQVKDVVNSFILEQNNSGPILHGYGDFKVGLIGYEKDQSSYYLNLFPQWQFQKVKSFSNINATDIRRIYFEEATQPHQMMAVAPSPVVKFMYNQFQYFQLIKSQYNFAKQYKKLWAKSPYPPTFCCADALVQVSDYVLLVQRATTPGKNLLALPGGYLQQQRKQTFTDAAIRQLRQQTRLKVPQPVLRGNIVKQKLFDNPYRSSRGRVITQVTHIKLNKQQSLPQVRGDKTQVHNAKWHSLSQLDQHMFFQDHYHILKNLINF